MKVKLITVGKLKEKYLVDGCKEYIKRLGNYCKVEIIEVSDESIPEHDSLAIEQSIKEKEGNKILDKIKQEEYVVLLDVAGKQMDSIELSKHMEQCMINGRSTITFIIGGSLGHGTKVIDRANVRLSFSKMTFPHQLMKLILVEQIYRAFKIMKNESYHK